MSRFTNWLRTLVRRRAQNFQHLRRWLSASLRYDWLFDRQRGPARSLPVRSARLQLDLLEDRNLPGSAVGPLGMAFGSWAAIAALDPVAQVFDANALTRPEARERARETAERKSSESSNVARADEKEKYESESRRGRDADADERHDGNLYAVRFERSEYGEESFESSSSAPGSSQLAPELAVAEPENQGVFRPNDPGLGLIGGGGGAGAGAGANSGAVHQPSSGEGRSPGLTTFGEFAPMPWSLSAESDDGASTSEATSASLLQSATNQESLSFFGGGDAGLGIDFPGGGGQNSLLVGGAELLAHNDSATTTLEEPVTISVLENDHGDISIDSYTQPLNGSVSCPPSRNACRILS